MTRKPNKCQEDHEGVRGQHTQIHTINITCVKTTTLNIWPNAVEMSTDAAKEGTGSQTTTATKDLKEISGFPFEDIFWIVRYTRSQLEDSRLLGPSPWKVLALIVNKMDS